MQLFVSGLAAVIEAPSSEHADMIARNALSELSGCPGVTEAHSVGPVVRDRGDGERTVWADVADLIDP